MRSIGLTCLVAFLSASLCTSFSSAAAQEDELVRNAGADGERAAEPNADADELSQADEPPPAEDVGGADPRTAGLDDRAPVTTTVEHEPDLVERVNRHDLRAQTLFDSGDYAGALAEQREAQTLLPATPRIFNMAVCQERLGRLTEAVALYRRFVEAGDAPEDRRDLARGRIQRLTEQLEAEHEGQGIAPRNEQNGRRSADDAPARDGLAPAAFWTMIGITSASVIATVVLGAVTLDLHNEFLDLYRGDEDSRALQEQGENLSQATNIMLVCSAFAAITALVLALDTDWNGGDESPDIALLPAVSSGGGMLALSGIF